jgi:hypothetical protein
VDGQEDVTVSYVEAGKVTCLQRFTSEIGLRTNRPSILGIGIIVLSNVLVGIEDVRHGLFVYMPKCTLAQVAATELFPHRRQTVKKRANGQASSSSSSSSREIPESLSLLTAPNAVFENLDILFLFLP